MKCPKCEYLGFETGDRCRNCGYDFSLLPLAAPVDEPDLPLQTPEASAAVANHWQDHALREVPAPRPAEVPAAPAPVARSVAAAAGKPASPRAAVPSLPLFQPGGADDDAPLIKMPAAPRAPLSVRRTPDRPKLRTVPRATRTPPSSDVRLAPPAPKPEPALFEEPVEAPARRPAVPAATAVPAAAALSSGPGPRLLAAAIDHALLFTVDLIVIYFTLKMAGLTLAEWQFLPPAPLLAFLLMLKFAYLSVFTALGGQTVGKMAAGIRVVAEDGRAVAPAGAARRALAGIASLLMLGLGFLPVLLSGDRRAVHDRVARTRVVAHS